MEEQKFKEKVYGPYGEAWKIIKILAAAEDNNPELDNVLRHYMDEVGKFKDKYIDNEFAQGLYKMLLNADSHIMRMDRNEVQEAEENK